MHTKAIILIVDKNHDARLMLTIHLSQQGFGVVSAQNIAEALELAQEIKFDLFIVDIRLPDGDGSELCSELKLIQPGVPVLYYTAAVLSSEKREAMSRCGDAYLAKPVCLADIESAIMDLVFVRKPEFDKFIP
jgi:DNA-binding response OmpR family regulator